MIEPERIGALTMRLLDLLEREYAGRQVELRAALVVVDVGVTDEDGDHWTHVRWQFGSDADGWDPQRSSSAYAAGLALQAMTGLSEGDAAEPP